MQQDPTAAEIRWQYCGVHVPSVVNEGKVQQGVGQLKNGQINVHNENRSGCPSIVNDDLVDRATTKLVKFVAS
jgi:hypothetical protein